LHQRFAEASVSKNCRPALAACPAGNVPLKVFEYRMNLCIDDIYPSYVVQNPLLLNECLLVY